MKNQDCYIRDFQIIYDYYLCNRGELIFPQCFINQNCLEDNNLIIKICIPDEEISAFTLSHLLNDLYVVNRELNKIIIHGLEEETGKKLDIKNIFELKVKEVRPGSCSIVTSIVLPIVTAEMIIPFVNELTDGRLQMLSVLFADILKEVLSNPHFLKNGIIKKHKADFYKRIHKLENVEEVIFTSKNTNPKNVTEDRMIDFYA